MFHVHCGTAGRTYLGIEWVREMLQGHVCFLFRKLCLAQQNNRLNPIFAIIIKLLIMALKWAFCTQGL